MDLGRLPVQTCWPEDAGPLITWGLTVTRGTRRERQNLGIYRQQVIGNDRLIMRRNRSLLTRLTYRLSIEPLSPDDTADYVRARLAAAGSTKEIFTSDAIAILHEAASGSLRDIDRVAHNALRISARKKRKLVDRDVVQAVLQLD